MSSFFKKEMAYLLYQVKTGSLWGLPGSLSVAKELHYEPAISDY
jgi:hypothetical protein